MGIAPGQLPHLYYCRESNQNKVKISPKISESSVSRVQRERGKLSPLIPHYMDEERK